MKRPTIFTLSILAGLGLAACSDDAPPPSESPRAHQRRSASVLREANAAYEGGTEAMPGGAASAAMDCLLGGDSHGLPAHPRRGGAAGRPRGLRSPGSPRSPSRRRAVDEAYDPDAKIAALAEKLFNDENHLGDGSTRCRPAVCTRTRRHQRPHDRQTLDAACAEKLVQAELRIRVTRAAASCGSRIQIDADHDEPLTIGLAKNASRSPSISTTRGARSTALGQLFGEELPNAELAGQITGRLRSSARRTASSTSTSIARSRSRSPSRAAALDGPDAYRFASAQAKGSRSSSTASEARLVRARPRATSAHVLDIFSTSADRDRYDLDLPGLTASTEFAAGQPLSPQHLARRPHRLDLDRMASAPRRSISTPRTAARSARRSRAIRRRRGDADGLAAARPAHRRRPRGVGRGGPGLRRHADPPRRQRAQRRGRRPLEVIDRRVPHLDEPGELRLLGRGGPVRVGDRRIDPTSSDFYTRWTVGACL